MLYDAMKEMLHCSREEREQMGRGGEREDGERVSERSCGGENSAESARG